MKTDGAKDQVSRRGFLGASSAALVATVGSLSVAGAVAQDKQVNARAANDRSATDPGPANAALDAQNPDSAWPPVRIPRAWFQTSNIRSLSRTSGLTKADGRGK
jgi:hypothetical protein